MTATVSFHLNDKLLVSVQHTQLNFISEVHAFKKKLFHYCYYQMYGQIQE